jgi:hypothetical protein
VDTLRTINANEIAERYALQRPFLGLVAQSAPLYLLNGNHEQASLFNYNQTDIRRDVAIGTQNARNRYFPTPAPDAFYTGNAEPLASIGLLKDYYSWTWGDALFVVLDNYWHSPVLVDTGFQERHDGGGRQGRGGGGDRDWWGLTLGDAQYHWFKRTLEQSKCCNPTLAITINSVRALRAPAGSTIVPNSRFTPRVRLGAASPSR